MFTKILNATSDEIVLHLLQMSNSDEFKCGCNFVNGCRKPMTFVVVTHVKKKPKNLLTTMRINVY